ncbi:unnamed protein product [Phytophthora fragariaefolia]|uniref:Unnamed protein product n=1 Tax=Phytophthora fragariaefolia TaxID=1490495 RepID=A0A9W6XIE9_9STRA|nr:unnamed protein product [Phytophthora fragariaefolia]
MRGEPLVEYAAGYTLAPRGADTGPQAADSKLQTGTVVDNAARTRGRTLCYECGGNRRMGKINQVGAGQNNNAPLGTRGNSWQYKVSQRKPLRTRAEQLANFRRYVSQQNENQADPALGGSEEGPCYYCDTNGHFARECRLKQEIWQPKETRAIASKAETRHRDRQFSLVDGFSNLAMSETRRLKLVAVGNMAGKNDTWRGAQQQLLAAVVGLTVIGADGWRGDKATVVGASCACRRYQMKVMKGRSKALRQWERQTVLEQRLGGMFKAIRDIQHHGAKNARRLIEEEVEPATLVLPHATESLKKSARQKKMQRYYEYHNGSTYGPLCVKVWIVSRSRCGPGLITNKNGQGPAHQTDQGTLHNVKLVVKAPDGSLAETEGREAPAVGLDIGEGVQREHQGVSAEPSGSNDKTAKP